MVMATGAGDGLHFQRHHLQVVRKTAACANRIEPHRQFGVLCGDARRIAALVPIVVSAGRRAEFVVFSL